jgi:hypothetical protein
MKKLNQTLICGLLIVPVLVLSGCDELLIDSAVEFETFEQSQALGDITKLDVELEYDVGTIEIARSESDQLYSIDLEYDRLHFDPDVDYDESGGSATLDFDVDSIGGGIFGDRLRNDLTLRLNEDVVVDLDLTVGVAESYLDFTNLKIRSLRLKGGVGRTEVLFDELAKEEMDLMDINSGVGDLTIRSIGNARVNRIRLKGGIGKTELDFTGDWEDWSTDADITVGVGKIHLRIPREIPVEIQSDESFLSNISAPGFEHRGNRYTRDPDGDGRGKIIIKVQSGVGGVTVELI